MALVTLPYAYIPNPVSDRSLFDGRIYIGQPGQTDVINNPKPATLIQEDGTQVPAQQPIAIGPGGVPVLNTSPVSIDVNGPYSILIQDRNGNQRYLSPNSGDAVDNSATDLRAFAIAVNVPTDQIGTTIATAAPGQSLNGSRYIFSSSDGAGYTLPPGIPQGSTVVSLTGTTLVTSNGQFTVLRNPTLNPLSFNAISNNPALQVNTYNRFTSARVATLPTNPADGQWVRVFSEVGSSTRIVRGSNNILVNNGLRTVNEVPFLFGFMEALFVWNNSTSRWSFVSSLNAMEQFLGGVPVPLPIESVPPYAFACSGQTFSTTENPVLAARYSDGRLPDLRGEFIRGWDASRGIDPSRNILSFQPSALQDHDHHLTRNQNVQAASSGSNLGPTSSISWGNGTTAVTESYNLRAASGNPNVGISSGIVNSAISATETRPRNIAMQYIVLRG